MKLFSNRGLTVFLIITLLNGCSYHGRPFDSENKLLSSENDIGEAIHQEIVQMIPVHHNIVVETYVDKIGHRIASVADRKDLNYRFVVLEDDRIYATSAPGGYVYITTGFFNLVENESELAAILAHEVGALQYRDPRASQLKKTIQFLTQIGAIVAPAFGGIGSLATIGLTGISASISRIKPKTSRLYDADKYALDHLPKLGIYQPQGNLTPHLF